MASCDGGHEHERQGVWKVLCINQTLKSKRGISLGLIQLVIYQDKINLI